MEFFSASNMKITLFLTDGQIVFLNKQNIQNDKKFWLTFLKERNLIDTDKTNLKSGID